MSNPTTTPYPSWLTALFDAEFSAAKSERDPKWRPLFCTQCKGKAFGRAEETRLHNNHPVIRVKYASRDPHIDVKDGDKLGINVSELHQYAINGGFVFRLKSTKTDTTKDSKKKSVDQFRDCKVCGVMMEYRTFRKASRFCSIQCYFDNYYVVVDEYQVVVDEDQARVVAPSRPPTSFRKRHRKGVPVRAPLW